MGKRKLSPLVQAITLYSSLEDRDKVTLSEYIKSQTETPRRPKSQTAASAKSKSLLKRLEAQSAASTETEKETATTAAVCAVPNCGLPEWAPIHSKETTDYHIFRAAIKTKGAGA